MKGTSEGKRGGRKRVEEGLSKAGREHGSNGGRETAMEVVTSVFINQPFTNRLLLLSLWYYI